MADPRIAPLASLGELFRLARHFEFRAVSRWVTFGLLVGVSVGGLAAALFIGADWVWHWVFGVGVGLKTPAPLGEPPIFGHVSSGGPVRYWLIVAAPGIGGLLCGALIHVTCKQARGGTDGYIEAFHQRRAHVPKRLAGVKLVASSVFLGFGSSAGREGPIAHIGSAVGAWFGRVFKLSNRDRRLLLVAGAAGGIGAIFRTPLGGALFAVEVLYRDDFEVDALVPAVLSSVVAYSIFTLIFGEGAMFAVAREFPFDPRQLPLYLVMAVGCAVVGALFVWGFDEMAKLFGRLRVWPPLRTALGGLLVGVLALATPWLWQSIGLIESADALLGAPVLGVGYGWLQELLLPTGLFAVGGKGIALLLLMALAKVLATCLSNASGGAGGVFGPSVVIGGFAGAAFGLAFHGWFPNVVPEPSAFCIVGMACFVGGVTHSPISTLVMASEMTGNYELLVPIMMAEGVTVALMRRWSHYSGQVATRRQSPAHVEDYALAALERLTVRDAAALGKKVHRVPAAMPLTELFQLAGELESSVVCVESEGRLVGVVNLESLRSIFNEDLGPLAIALDCASPMTTLLPSDTLAHALERLTESHLPQLPVQAEDDSSSLVGLLHLQEVLDAYSREVHAGRAETEEAASTSRHGFPL